jgi:hypothetical protein
MLGYLHFLAAPGEFPDKYLPLILSDEPAAENVRAAF